MTPAGASNDNAATITDVATVENASATGRIVLVCEHASAHIPSEFNNLGLSAADRYSHAAWDPGALGLSLKMATRLNAPLVHSNISRLVYDCNRPLSAPDAMPTKSEEIIVPGNQNLSVAQKEARSTAFYLPFEALVAKTIAARKAGAILVTVHSFTPTYFGKPRRTEIGLIHDEDPRLAQEIAATMQANGPHGVTLNAPYSRADGVTHTLAQHGSDILNVMIEVRNDLLADDAAQCAVADQLCSAITRALAALGEDTGEAA